MQAKPAPRRVHNLFAQRLLLEKKLNCEEPLLQVLTKSEEMGKAWRWAVRKVAAENNKSRAGEPMADANGQHRAKEEKGSRPWPKPTPASFFPQTLAPGPQIPLQAPESINFMETAKHNLAQAPAEILLPSAGSTFDMDVQTQSVFTTENAHMANMGYLECEEAAQNHHNKCPNRFIKQFNDIFGPMGLIEELLIACNCPVAKVDVDIDICFSGPAGPGIISEFDSRNSSRYSACGSESINTRHT
ncbi:hypothetical protein DFH27DRAFT_613994 [Peziza echinospora]|nr:hypothetical protein DFH27DRAFT_613994 [Peziza echinospora]